MSGEKQLIIDKKSRLFDKKAMFHKKLPSDFRQIRYFTMLIVQKAPAGIKEINLLEQQISELIKNAVKHGNKCDLNKNIEVWYSFSEIEARLIVQDQGQGFKRLEEWNEFNRIRNECFRTQNFEEMSKYVSFITEESDEMDNGNALFAALEYWNGGIVYNQKRNCIAVKKNFPRRRFGITVNSTGDE
jgi:hypothetical protein